MMRARSRPFNTLLVGLAVALAGTACEQQTCDELRDRLRLRFTGVSDNPFFDADLLSPPNDLTPARCLRLEPAFHRLPPTDGICDPSLDCFMSDCLPAGGGEFRCGGAPTGNLCEPDLCPADSLCRAAPGADSTAPEFRCRPSCTPICPGTGACEQDGFACTDDDSSCDPDSDCPAGETCGGTMCSDGVTPCDPDANCGGTGTCAPRGRCPAGGARCDLGKIDECEESGTACIPIDEDDLRGGGWCDNPNGPVCMRMLRHLFADPLGLGRDFCPRCEEYELSICDCKSGPALFQCISRWAAVRELRSPPDARLERRVCRVTLQSFECVDVLAPTVDDFGDNAVCGSGDECVGGRCALLDPTSADPASTGICSSTCASGADCPRDLYTDYHCGEMPLDRYGTCRDEAGGSKGSAAPCDSISEDCPAGERCVPSILPPVCVPNDDTLIPHVVGESCVPNSPHGCEPFTCYRLPDDEETGEEVGICSVRCTVLNDPECPGGFYCSIEKNSVFPERGPFCNELLGFGAPCAAYGDEADMACGGRCVERMPDPETGESRRMCAVNCKEDIDCTAVTPANGDFCRSGSGLTGTGETTPFCDAAVALFDPCSLADMAPSNGCLEGDICATLPSGETICTRECDLMNPSCIGGHPCVDIGVPMGVCDPT